MHSNPIHNLRIQAEEAWHAHFEMCSNKGIWATINANLTDIKMFEISWKLRWIESNLKKLSQ